MYLEFPLLGTPSFDLLVGYENTLRKEGLIADADYQFDLLSDGSVRDMIEPSIHAIGDRALRFFYAPGNRAGFFWRGGKIR